MSSLPLIWALSDGRAGNEAQSLALAEALGRLTPVRIETRRVELKSWARHLPAALWHAAGVRDGGWPFSGLTAGRETLVPPWPSLVIGTGRRVAPITAALGRLYNVRTVQVLDPKMPPRAFDLLVSPSHDATRAPNLIQTLGAIGRLTPARITNAAQIWQARLDYLPMSRIAVLLGGPSKSARWAVRDADRFVEQLAELSRAGHGLMITPSRRTDPAVAAALRDACDPESTYLWGGQGDNPYPGILGLADAIVVTEDSVNMASEAASTGVPVHVFRIAHVAPKLKAFHAALETRGIARKFDGKLESWSYEPLAEADRVARMVIDRALLG